MPGKQTVRMAVPHSGTSVCTAIINMALFFGAWLTHQKTPTKY